MKLIKSFKAWVKSHDLSIPHPETTYRLKKAAEIKAGFEVYIMEMDHYLLTNNLNGKIKIPRWTKDFYSLPKMYMGRELIWGNK